MLESLTERIWRRRKAETESVRHRSPDDGVSSEPAPLRQNDDWLEHHTAREHAHLLVGWIRRNVELERGMVFHEAMREFYAEAINDAGWAPRPWNPVARQVDLICTGGSKPYTWMMTARGRMKRRRYYPIPAAIEQRRAA